jgi:phosphoglycerate kinase
MRFGLLLAKEIESLKQSIEKTVKKTSNCCLGGSKVSSKITVIENILDKVDHIIGGGMTFTFVKALGVPLGNSICEDDKQELAGNFKIGQRKGVQIHIPVDVIAADKRMLTQTDVNEILMVGKVWTQVPKSLEQFKKVIMGS